MSDEEIRELEDPGNWAEEGETRRPTKPPRAVVSVAFAREDFETIAANARSDGMKTSEFIRVAVLDRLRRRPTSSVVSASGAVRLINAPNPSATSQDARVTIHESERTYTTV